jgi:hypothetical protein
MWTAWLTGQRAFPENAYQAILGDPQWRLSPQQRRDWEQNRSRLIDEVGNAFSAAAEICKLPLAEQKAMLERWAAALEQLGWLAQITLPSFDRAAEAYFRHAVESAFLDAAIAVMLEGEAALQNHPDPATGKPFGYEKSGEGFVLSSEKQVDGQPMRLEVNRPA